MRPALIVFAALTFVSSAHADVEQAVHSAASATVRGVEKAEKAVVHAAKVAASGVEYGVKKASEAVNTAARKVGLPTEGASAPAK